nr:hypothetical protein [uncultured Roseateles sp.]
MDMSMELTLRDIPAFLPPWTFAKVGRPDERRARHGARRCFVDLKMSFMRAAAEVQGLEGQALQEHVRQAVEPIELWLMHTRLLASLPLDHLRGDQHRQALQEALARVFPAGSAT